MFSNCHILHNEQFLPRLIGCLESANKEVFISTFKMQSSNSPAGRKIMSLYSALIDAAERGVSIKVLCNFFNGISGGCHYNTHTARQFKHSNIEYRGPNNSRIIHSKIAIFDRSISIIGSHNLSIKSNNSNYETSVIFECPAFSTELSYRFLQEFQNATIL